MFTAKKVLKFLPESDDLNQGGVMMENILFINACVREKSRTLSLAQYILDKFPNKKLEEVWDYEKNGDFNPWKLEKGSHKKIWIKCQEKDYHESYEMSCANFSSEHRCPYCQGRKVHKKDSLGQYVTDKHGEDFLWCIWSDKNEMSPFEVSIYSHKKVWWNCPDNKHEKYYKIHF